MAIVGPNGVGKTMMFNLTSGTDPPDASHILFGGTRVARYAA
jgi:ABC-type branched-subunit amino acid transport system ATPase component